MKRTHRIYQQGRFFKTFEILYPNSALIVRADRFGDEEMARKLETELDHQTLFSELEQIEDHFAAHYLKAESDLETYQYYKDLNLFKKLSQIQVASKEFKALQKRLSEIDTKKIAQFIVQESGKPIVLSKAWEASLQNAIRFYETANARDQVLEQMLMGHSKHSEENVSALVYGGFHKEAIKEILKRQGYSYVIVSPKITDMSERHQQFYRERMSIGYQMPTSLVATATNAPRDFAIASVLPNYGLQLKSEVRSLVEVVQGLTNPTLESIELAIQTKHRSELRALSSNEREVHKESLLNELLKLRHGMIVSVDAIVKSEQEKLSGEYQLTRSEVVEVLQRGGHFQITNDRYQIRSLPRNQVDSHWPRSEVRSKRQLSRSLPEHKEMRSKESDELIRILKTDPDDTQRTAALDIVFERHSFEGSLEAVIYALSDPSSNVRGWATNYLFQITDDPFSVFLEALRKLRVYRKKYEGDRDPRLPADVEEYDEALAGDNARSAVIYAIGKYIQVEEINQVLEKEAAEWKQNRVEKRLRKIHDHIPLNESGYRVNPLGVHEELSLLETLRLRQIWNQELNAELRRREFKDDEIPLAITKNHYVGEKIREMVPRPKGDDAVNLVAQILYADSMLAASSTWSRIRPYLYGFALITSLVSLVHSTIYSIFIKPEIMKSYLSTLFLEGWFLTAVAAVASLFGETKKFSRTVIQFLIVATGLVGSFYLFHSPVDADKIVSFAQYLPDVSIRLPMIFTAVFISQFFFTDATVKKALRSAIRWSLLVGIVGGYFAYYLIAPYLNSVFPGQELETVLLKTSFDVGVTTFILNMFAILAQGALGENKNIIKDLWPLHKSNLIKASLYLYPINFLYWFPAIALSWFFASNLFIFSLFHNIAFFIWVAFLAPVVSNLFETSKTQNEGVSTKRSEVRTQSVTETINLMEEFWSHQWQSGKSLSSMSEGLSRTSVRDYFEEFYMEIFLQNPNAKILDIGAGHFYLSLIGAKLFQSEEYQGEPEFHGVDPADIGSWISEMKTELEKRNQTEFRPIIHHRSRTEDLAHHLPRHSFDVMTSLTGFFYASDVEKALRSMNYLLKPEGRFQGVLHFKNSSLIQDTLQSGQEAYIIRDSRILHSLKDYLENPDSDDAIENLKSSIEYLQEHARNRGKHKNKALVGALNFAQATINAIDPSEALKIVYKFMASHARDLAYVQFLEEVKLYGFGDQEELKALFEKHGFEVQVLKPYEPYADLIGWQVELKKVREVEAEEFEKNTRSEMRSHGRSAQPLDEQFGVSSVIEEGQKILELANEVWQADGSLRHEDFVDQGYVVGDKRMRDLFQQEGLFEIDSPYTGMSGRIHSWSEGDLLQEIRNELVRNGDHLPSDSEMHIFVRTISARDHKAIEMIAIDDGPGIEDIQWAVQKGHTSKDKKLRGFGLSSILDFATSGQQGFVEIVSGQQGYRYGLLDSLQPQHLEVNYPKGTYIRVVRFYSTHRSELRSEEGEADAEGLEFSDREETKIQNWLEKMKAFRAKLRTQNQETSFLTFEPFDYQHPTFGRTLQTKLVFSNRLGHAVDTWVGFIENNISRLQESVDQKYFLNLKDLIDEFQMVSGVLLHLTQIPINSYRKSDPLTSKVTKYAILSMAMNALEDSSVREHFSEANISELEIMLSEWNSIIQDYRKIFDMVDEKINGPKSREASYDLGKFAMVVLGDGQSTRFWPEDKLTVNLTGDQSLIAKTIERLTKELKDHQGNRFRLKHSQIFPVVVDDPERESPWHDLDIPDGNILKQPERKSTFAALIMAVTALASRAKNGEDYTVATIPADHWIPDTHVIRETMLRMTQAAQDTTLNTIVVAGTKPTNNLQDWTRFGAIKIENAIFLPTLGNPALVNQFIEKPSIEAAKNMMGDESGNWYWNTGMMFFRISNFENVLQEYHPDLYEQIYLPMIEAFKAKDEDRVRELFSRIPLKVQHPLNPEREVDNAIDYAVAMPMTKPEGKEKSSVQLVMVPTYHQWVDVGTWGSLLEVRKPNIGSNLVHGNAYADASVKHSVLIDQSGRTFATDLEEAMVIRSAKGHILIASRQTDPKRVQSIARYLHSGTPLSDARVRVYDLYNGKRLAVIDNELLKIRIQKDLIEVDGLLQSKVRMYQEKLERHKVVEMNEHMTQVSLTDWWTGLYEPSLGKMASGYAAFSMGWLSALVLYGIFTGEVLFSIYPISGVLFYLSTAIAVGLYILNYVRYVIDQSLDVDSRLKQEERAKSPVVQPSYGFMFIFSVLMAGLFSTPLQVSFLFHLPLIIDSQMPIFYGLMIFFTLNAIIYFLINKVQKKLAKFHAQESTAYQLSREPEFLVRVYGAEHDLGDILDVQARIESFSRMFSMNFRNIFKQSFSSSFDQSKTRSSISFEEFFDLLKKVHTYWFQTEGFGSKYRAEAQVKWLTLIDILNDPSLLGSLNREVLLEWMRDYYQPKWKMSKLKRWYLGKWLQFYKQIEIVKEIPAEELQDFIKVVHQSLFPDESELANFHPAVKFYTALQSEALLLQPVGVRSEVRMLKSGEVWDIVESETSGLRDRQAVEQIRTESQDQNWWDEQDLIGFIRTRYNELVQLSETRSEVRNDQPLPNFIQMSIRYDWHKEIDLSLVDQSLDSLISILEEEVQKKEDGRVTHEGITKLVQGLSGRNFMEEMNSSYVDSRDKAFHFLYRELNQLPDYFDRHVAHVLHLVAYHLNYKLAVVDFKGHLYGHNHWEHSFENQLEKLQHAVNLYNKVLEQSNAYQSVRLLSITDLFQINLGVPFLDIGQVEYTYVTLIKALRRLPGELGDLVIANFIFSVGAHLQQNYSHDDYPDLQYYRALLEYAMKRLDSDQVTKRARQAYEIAIVRSLLPIAMANSGSITIKKGDFGEQQWRVENKKLKRFYKQEMKKIRAIVKRVKSFEEERGLSLLGLDSELFLHLYFTLHALKMPDKRMGWMPFSEIISSDSVDMVREKLELGKDFVNQYARFKRLSSLSEASIENEQDFREDVKMTMEYYSSLGFPVNHLDFENSDINRILQYLLYLRDKIFQIFRVNLFFSSGSAIRYIDFGQAARKDYQEIESYLRRVARTRSELRDADNEDDLVEEWEQPPRKLGAFWKMLFGIGALFGLVVFVALLLDAFKDRNRRAQIETDNDQEVEKQEPPIRLPSPDGVKLEQVQEVDSVIQADTYLNRIVSHAKELAKEPFVEQKVTAAPAFDYPAFDFESENSVQPAKIIDPNGTGALAYPRRGTLQKEIKIFYENESGTFEEFLFDSSLVQYPERDARGNFVPTELPQVVRHWTQVSLFTAGPEGFPQYRTILANGYSRTASIGSAEIEETVYGTSGRAFVKLGKLGQVDESDLFFPERREVYLLKSKQSGFQIYYEVFEDPDAVMVRKVSLYASTGTINDVQAYVFPRKGKSIRDAHRFGFGYSSMYWRGPDDLRPSRNQNAAYDANTVTVAFKNGQTRTHTLRNPPADGQLARIEQFGALDNSVVEWSLESRYESVDQFIPGVNYHNRASFYIEDMQFRVDGRIIPSRVKSILLSPDFEYKDNVVVAAIPLLQTPVEHGQVLSFSYRETVKRQGTEAETPKQTANFEIQSVGVVRQDEIEASKVKHVTLEKGFGFEYAQNGGDYAGAYANILAPEAKGQKLVWDWQTLGDEKLPSVIQVKIEADGQTLVTKLLEVNSTVSAELELPENLPANFRVVLINEAHHADLGFTREPVALGATDFQIKPRSEVRAKESQRTELVHEEVNRQFRLYLQSFKTTGSPGVAVINLLNALVQAFRRYEDAQSYLNALFTQKGLQPNFDRNQAKRNLTAELRARYRVRSEVRNEETKPAEDLLAKWALESKTYLGRRQQDSYVLDVTGQQIDESILDLLANDLAGLFFNAFPDERGNQARHLKPEAWKEWMTSESHQIFILRGEKGKLEGFVLLKKYPEYVTLDRIVVKGSKQNDGRGSLMMDAIFRWVMENQSPAIRWDANRSSASFYNKYLERNGIDYNSDETYHFHVDLKDVQTLQERLKHSDFFTQGIALAQLSVEDLKNMLIRELVRDVYFHYKYPESHRFFALDLYVRYLQEHYDTHAMDYLGKSILTGFWTVPTELLGETMSAYLYSTDRVYESGGMSLQERKTRILSFITFLVLNNTENPEGRQDFYTRMKFFHDVRTILSIFHKDGYFNFDDYIEFSKSLESLEQRAQLIYLLGPLLKEEGNDSYRDQFLELVHPEEDPDYFEGRRFLQSAQEPLEYAKRKANLFEGYYRSVPYHAQRLMYGVMPEAKVLAFFEDPRNTELRSRMRVAHVFDSTFYVRYYVQEINGKKTLIIGDIQSDPYRQLRKNPDLQKAYRDYPIVAKLMIEDHARRIGAEQIISPLAETVVERWPGNEDGGRGLDKGLARIVYDAQMNKLLYKKMTLDLQWEGDIEGERTWWVRDLSEEDEIQNILDGLFGPNQPEFHGAVEFEEDKTENELLETPISQLQGRVANEIFAKLSLYDEALLSKLLQAKGDEEVSHEYLGVIIDYLYQQGFSDREIQLLWTENPEKDILVITHNGIAAIFPMVYSQDRSEVVILWPHINPDLLDSDTDLFAMATHFKRFFLGSDIKKLYLFKNRNSKYAYFYTQVEKGSVFNEDDSGIIIGNFDDSARSELRANIFGVDEELVGLKKVKFLPNVYPRYGTNNRYWKDLALQQSYDFIQQGLFQSLSKRKPKWKRRAKLRILGIGIGAGLDSLALVSYLSRESMSAFDLFLVDIDLRAVKNTKDNLLTLFESLGWDAALYEKEGGFQIDLGDRGRVFIAHVETGREFEMLEQLSEQTVNRIDFAYMNAPGVVGEPIDPDYSNIVIHRDDFLNLVIPLSERLSQTGIFTTAIERSMRSLLSKTGLKVQQLAKESPHDQEDNRYTYELSRSEMRSKSEEISQWLRDAPAYMERKGLGKIINFADLEIESEIEKQLARELWTIFKAASSDDEVSPYNQLSTWEMRVERRHYSKVFILVNDQAEIEGYIVTSSYAPSQGSDLLHMAVLPHLQKGNRGTFLMDAYFHFLRENDYTRTKWISYPTSILFYEKYLQRNNLVNVSEKYGHFDVNLRARSEVRTEEIESDQQDNQSYDAILRQGLLRLPAYDTHGTFGTVVNLSEVEMNEELRDLVAERLTQVFQFAFPGATEKHSLKNKENWKEYFDSENEKVFALIDPSGTIDGFFFIRTHRDRNFIELNRVGLRGILKKGGRGTYLMDILFKWARENDFRTLHWEANDDSIEFYIHYLVRRSIQYILAASTRIQARVPSESEWKAAESKLLNVRQSMRDHAQVPATMFFSYEDVIRSGNSIRESLFALAWMTRKTKTKFVIYGTKDLGHAGLDLFRDFNSIQITPLKIEDAYQSFGEKRNGRNVNVSDNATLLKERVHETTAMSMRHFLSHTRDDIWGAYLLLVSDPSQNPFGFNQSDGYFQAGEFLRSEIRSYQASLVVMMSA